MSQTLGVKTHEMFLKETDRKVTFLTIRALNLFVITDARGFGSNWIKVSHTDKTYDAEPLMGPDLEQNITSIARFFAATVMKERLKAMGDTDFPAIQKTDLLFSISLRETGPSVIREINEEFQKVISM